MYKCVNVNVWHSQLLQGLLLFLVAVVVMFTLILVWILCWFRLICYLLDWPYHPFQTTWIYGETPSWKIWIFDASAALMVHSNSAFTNMHTLDCATDVGILMLINLIGFFSAISEMVDIWLFKMTVFWLELWGYDFACQDYTFSLHLRVWGFSFFSLQVVELQMKFCTWCQIKKTLGWR